MAEKKPSWTVAIDFAKQTNHELPQQDRLFHKFAQVIPCLCSF